MKIVLASHNQGKLKEFQAILLNLNYEIVLASDVGINLDEFEETGTTYEENALLKARYVYEQTGLTSIADDSGIKIHALPDILGVYSARFMGSDTSYDLKNKALLEILSDKSDRSAVFTSVIALVSEQEEMVFEGVVNGTIAKSIHGKGGFGYDPIFIPDGYHESYAQMDSNTKNSMSHRALALQKCLNYLRKLNHDS